MSEEKRRISYDDFLAVVLSDCRTLSGTARPTEGEIAHQYDVRLADLLQNLYSVWFVDDSRTAILNYNDPGARAIRAEELAALSELLRPRLEACHKGSLHLSSITEVSCIILHCTGCDRRVLIDGVHRTMWLLGRGKYSASARVTELSGSQWPVETPDLNVVCTCARSVQ